LVPPPPSSSSYSSSSSSSSSFSPLSAYSPPSPFPLDASRIQFKDGLTVYDALRNLMEENISLRKELKDLHRRFSSLSSASSTVVSTHAPSSSSSAPSSSSSSSSPSSSSSSLPPRSSSPLLVNSLSPRPDDPLDPRLLEMSKGKGKGKSLESFLLGPVGLTKKKKDEKEKCLRK
jgi:hypothetical protein